MAIASHWLLLFSFCSTSLFFTAEAFLGVVRSVEASRLSSTKLHLLGEDDIVDDHERICIRKENNLIVERRTFLETLSLVAATTDDAYAADIEENLSMNWKRKNDSQGWHGSVKKKLLGRTTVV